MKNTLYGLMEWIDEEKFSCELADEGTQEPEYLDAVIDADDLKKRVQMLIQKVRDLIKENDVSAEVLKKILGQDN